MNSLDTEYAELVQNPSWLKQLVPVKELGPEDREKLAIKSRVIDAWPGQVIVGADEHRWLVYLLEGQVQLVERDQPPESVHYNDLRARHPLFSEKAHKVQAIVQTPCKLARFDRQFFHTLLEQTSVTGEDLENIEVSEAESHLFNAIMHAFNMDLLELPSLPEIAQKVNQAVSHPDVSVENLVHIMEADPAVVARLIQVANSPLSRGVDPVRSIQAAIVRLGLATTRDLVVSLSVKQLFQSQSAVLKSRMHDLYEHSIEVAAIAYTLSHEVDHLVADDMLLAGLMHDIGVIPILNYIEKTGLQVDNDDELENIIAGLRILVGSMVIRTWALSPELVSVVENAENWYRDTPGNADVSDVIIVAQIYNRLQHQQVKGLPKFNQVPAFNKLFPGEQDPQLIENVLQQADEKMLEVMRLLHL